MQNRWTFGGILMAAALAAGCGDHNNFFGSLADDNSTDAKIEEAQQALDNGDCQTAINGFTEAFNDRPNDVGIRIGLAAAFTCRAGFNITELIRIGADYVASGNNADQFDLFSAIADGAVNLVSPTWDEDTAQAIEFLTDPNLPVTGACSPAPFANDPDAAFNQALVSTIRAVMAVSALEDTVTGVILTGNITEAAAALVGDALRDADQGIACSNSIVGGSVVVDTDVAQTIADLNAAANNLDGIPDNNLTAAELTQFLIDQGVEIAP